MNKTLFTALSTLIIAHSAASAAPGFQTAAVDADGMEYSALYTESAWMAVEVPRAALGDMVPSDLSIAVSGLPEGTTITLDSVDTQDDRVLLHVTVERESTASTVNSVASIDIKSGDTVLTTVSIPVYGAAYGE